MSRSVPEGVALLIIINGLAASIARGTASGLNTYFMRQIEKTNGVEIFANEELTQRIGCSKKCAVKAVNESSFQEVCLLYLV